MNTNLTHSQLVNLMYIIRLVLLHRYSFILRFLFVLLNRLFSNFLIVQLNRPIVLCGVVSVLLIAIEPTSSGVIRHMNCTTSNTHNNPGSTPTQNPHSRPLAPPMRLLPLLQLSDAGPTPSFGGEQTSATVKW